ncbi:MAG: hypothetical protein J6Y08_03400 [Clostridiales bacterium]|nr:hypothetical protein [Clostridiales bacterium]
MKKSIRTLLAFALAGSMLLGLSACGNTKKDNNGTTDSKETVSSDNTDTEEEKDQSDTQGTDPAPTTQQAASFYHAECAELQLEPIKDVEFGATIFSNSSIVGDRILINVIAIPKEESMEALVLENNYQSLGDGLYTSLQLFDLTGKNIATVQMDENCTFENAFALDNGEILVVTNRFDDGECISSPFVFVISPSGERLRDLTFDVSANLYGSHVYPMENGNIFVAAEGNLFLFDSEGNLINSVTESTLWPFMNYSEGKWYVAHVAPPYTEIAGFQEVDINTGELKDRYQSDTSIAYDLARNTDCYVFTERGMLQYLITEKKTKPVLSSDNTDLDFTDLRNCQILPDGSMIVLNSVPDKDVDPDTPSYFRGEANKMSVAILTPED